MRPVHLLVLIVIVSLVQDSLAQNAPPVAYDDPGVAFDGFESIDFLTLPWRLSVSGGGWGINDGVPISGAFSAQTIADFGDTATLQLQVVTGDGTISFSRSNLGPGTDGDVLRFLIDGAVQEEVSDNTAPANVSFPITAGVHTFTWEYESFINRGASPGSAQLDDVAFPPPVYITDEATAFTTPTVLGNDYDSEEDSFGISSVDTSGTLGLVSDNGDGTFDYDPNGAFDALNNGDQALDAFSYTISQDGGGEDSATVTITITGIGDPVENIVPVPVLHPTGLLFAMLALLLTGFWAVRRHSAG